MANSIVRAFTDPGAPPMMGSGLQFAANGVTWVADHVERAPKPQADRQLFAFTFRRVDDPWVTRRLRLWLSEVLLFEATESYRSRLALIITDWLCGPEVDGEIDYTDLEFRLVDIHHQTNPLARPRICHAAGAYCCRSCGERIFLAEGDAFPICSVTSVSALWVLETLR